MLCPICGSIMEYNNTCEKICCLNFKCSYTMRISDKLRQRFCKDYNIPIKIFAEPYFSDRLKLFQAEFGALDKWHDYLCDIALFSSEQEYFEYYNKLRDKIINHIKEKPEFQQFNTCDMNLFRVDTHGISRKDIYHAGNDGRCLVSIDLKKANFQALKHFNPKIVNGCKTYEDFVRQFTDFKSIINSKYVRQVIFGNANPSRQVTYERYLMHFVLEEILKYLGVSQVLVYTDDEIVFEDTDKTETIREAINKLSGQLDIEFHFDVFQLRRIPDTDAYVKCLSDGTREFKCVSAWLYPFILRAYAGEQPKDSDFVFIYESGNIARFLNAPHIEVA